MRKTATMTTKGQVTVPRAIREALKLQAGDRVLFVQQDGRVTLTVEKEEDPFEEFRGRGTPGIAKGKKAVLRWVRDVRGEV